MPDFTGVVLTENGEKLLTQLITGENSIRFTKICTSSKYYDELESLTELEDIKQSVDITDVVLADDTTVQVSGVFSNKNLTEGYTLRTIGLYVADSSDTEYLYACCSEETGEYVITGYNGTTVYTVEIQLITTIGNAESVILEVDTGVYARKDYVDEQTEELKIYVDEQIKSISGTYTYDEDTKTLTMA